ncbi:hypothetical protein CORC01_07944 [Colletotrichum orchidophilum]|uniref:DUF7587 domain-containing protein n=1 Tax=Colletotrichum orchidophilum TaxID=1209926 RepID=A0A1G4B5S1_9PEZI|nr:uncharacterized protein CORC01_07944 [Colletotrichum orchidophilum]OHE96798.1 hypothetical protein CORC01_07944 [Colletotrichum orchidophilum]
MESVPQREVVVARYERMVEKIADNDSASVKAWLTKNTTDNTPWVLRALPEYVQVLKNQFPGFLHIIKHSRNSGVVNGTALLSINHKVHTVDAETRPTYLYRTIHGDHPYKGIKARLGRGTDPIFLHIHLRKHLRWRCRELSPFLSSTDSLAKAVRIAKLYEDRGFSDITILKFKTIGPAWDHDKQRLWDPKSLLRQLNLHGDIMHYLDNEFLVEHSIPESCIEKRWKWGRRKAEFDPDGDLERRAREDLDAKKAMADKAKKRREAVKKQEENAAARKRKASDEGGEDGNSGDDDQDGLKPWPEKRKYGKRVKVGVKLRRDGGD